MKEEVKRVVEPESWMAHPEILFLHLLSSTDKTKRQFAVDKILALRGSDEFGQTANRPFLPPKLNWDAISEEEIIDWEETVVTEPIQTARLSREEIEGFAHSPLVMRNFTCHGKALEKVKNQVKNACEEAIGPEAREEIVHRRCDPQIIVARNPNNLASDESDPDYEDDLWTEPCKKRGKGDSGKRGGGAGGGPNGSRSDGAAGYLRSFSR